MKADQPKDIGRIFREGTAIDLALERAALEAKREHERLGLPPQPGATVKWCGIGRGAEGVYAGVEEHSIEGVTVRVYIPAKTVADSFKVPQQDRPRRGPGSSPRLPPQAPRGARRSVAVRQDLPRHHRDPALPGGPAVTSAGLRSCPALRRMLYSSVQAPPRTSPGWMGDVASRRYPRISEIRRGQFCPEETTS